MRFWWLILPVVGVAEFVLHLLFASAAPTLDEWRAAASTLRSMRKQDELVVVAPHWADPNARHAFGDALMPIKHLARADESGFQTAIEVSILGQDAPELSNWKLLDEQGSGGIRFRRVQNPEPATVRYDFVDQLGPETTEVFSGSGKSPRPCSFNARASVSNGTLQGHPTFPRRRFQCGGAWQFVGVTILEDSDWRPRRCIWSHPPRRGATITRFKDVPLGSVIRGYGALPYYQERHKKGSPVELEVLVNDTSIGTYEHMDGESWKRFEFSVGEHANSSATVEFRVAAARPDKREFCFQADTR